MRTYNHLLSSGRIGTLELKNRVIMAPMHTMFSSAEGFVTPRLIQHYAERAKGGVGLVIVEYTHIDSKFSRKGEFGHLGIWDDRFIPGLTDLAEAIKENGAKAGIQICHVGPRRSEKPKFGTKPMPGKELECVGPSAIPWTPNHPIPRELLENEIEEIIGSFANAARIAKQSGFDLIEIHGTHGYLIASFISPRTNQRADRYGGSFENRMRLPLAVLEAVRMQVGASFPLSYRISGDDYLDDKHFDIKQPVEVSRLLEKAGINALHISSSDQWLKPITPSYVPQGIIVDLASNIKQAVSIPVIASCGIHRPDLVEKVLEEERADFVSVGRQLFADPQWLNKVKSGKTSQIIPCIRCLHCLERLGNYQGLRCSVNPASGREESYVLEKARECLDVLVVGGGAAGLSAAAASALRGHKVTLWEKRVELGGHLIEATRFAFKQDLLALKDSLIARARSAGVQIVTGQEGNLELIKKKAPDAVILAVGSKLNVPPVRGIDQSNVSDALQVLAGKTISGKRVLVVGAGLVGCELAWSLAEKGHSITVSTMEEEIALDVEWKHRGVLLEQFRKLGVDSLRQATLSSVEGNVVTFKDRHNRDVVVNCDQVILATGFTPRRELIEEVKAAGILAFDVGDCVSARKVGDAIHEGEWVARWL